MGSYISGQTSRGVRVKHAHLFSSVCGVCLLILSAGVYAADENLKKANQLLGKHYYESAAALLRSTSAANPPNAETILTLARAYAQNARLQRAMQRSSLDIGALYLKKLAAQTGRDRSSFVALYYGEYLTEAGRQREGAAQLRNFIGQKHKEHLYREIAQADLSVTQKSIPAVSAKSPPLLRSQQALVLSLLPDHKAEANALTEQTLAELAKTNPTLPVRAASNAFGVYARSGQSAKALALIGNADLSQPSYEETINSAKVLRFYDAALLGNLATLYQVEAERLLQKAGTESRLKAVSNYFRIELYLHSGQFSKASTLLPELLAATDLPQPYRDRLEVMQAALDVRSGKMARGNAAFNTLAKKHEQDPALLGELLMACVQHKAKCPGAIGSARNLAASNQGEKFRSLHFAVGEHYASEGKTDRALQELETARDKSNKNRIDANDPMLLVRLADLYFVNKSFSESLEIYFEMSKEFPALRQLQEAAQGVYSTEYRSAGDAKIF